MENLGEKIDFSFFKNKRVMITGNTGFKGSWMTMVLLKCEAKVYGYALKANVDSLFNELRLEDKIIQKYGDIRDINLLEQFMLDVKPDIIIHMAAQPLVRKSYLDPVNTYEVNVMGTVNVLEVSRKIDCLHSIVNVTTDKVYKNNEWHWGYRENDILNGYDPYSNSKSCSELVTDCYKKSYFNQNKVAVSTCRAGNVIGGGDFAEDRIIPDCVRAVMSGKKIKIRNPKSIRPYQYVLEPVVAYLQIAMCQYIDYNLNGEYNIGPQDTDCIDTLTLVKYFCESWGEESVKWEVKADFNGGHEAGLLKLDISKVYNVFKWKPQYTVYEAIEKTVEWSKEYAKKNDVYETTCKQVVEYLSARNIIY